MCEAWLKPGRVVRVGGAASVQIQGRRAITLRIVRVDRRATYEGWVWLEGYVLDSRGRAVQRRIVFVLRAGLRPYPPD
ncbi:hypothetical protein [Krasilnikovia sp. M28-CT-15]|uniref:hypothetical protein n=1 Tax=Krasilnikovia sp. M28-CT-15 TaxID=3373540 RepID=UPI003876DACB